MSVLNTTILSDSVVQVEAANGSLHLTKAGYCPVLESSSVGGRLEAALCPPQPSVIAIGLSAAWVWGAVRTQPRVMQYAVKNTARERLKSAVPHTLREQRYEAEDIVTLRSRQITSPVRTILELLSSANWDNLEHQVAIRLLMTRYDPQGVGTRSRLNAGTRFQNGAQLRERLNVQLSAEPIKRRH